MCGGCNIYAEAAGVSLIVARYWWVAHLGTRTVAEAEAVVAASNDVPADDFVDPLPELLRVT